MSTSPLLAKPLLASMLIGAAATSLVACGQAGPLYLPENAPQKSSLFKKSDKKPAGATTPAPASDSPAPAQPATQPLPP